MALKDWKKIQRSRNGFRYERKVSRYSRRNEYIQIERYGDEYDVWHTTNPFGSGGVHEKIITTNSLEYAKRKAREYMKKH